MANMELGISKELKKTFFAGVYMLGLGKNLNEIDDLAKIQAWNFANEMIEAEADYVEIKRKEAIYREQQ